MWQGTWKDVRVTFLFYMKLQTSLSNFPELRKLLRSWDCLLRHWEWLLRNWKWLLRNLDCLLRSWKWLLRHWVWLLRSASELLRNWSEKLDSPNIFASGSPYKKLPLWNRLYTFLDCICSNDSRFILLASEDSLQLFLDQEDKYISIFQSNYYQGNCCCFYVSGDDIYWLDRGWAVKHIWPYTRSSLRKWKGLKAITNNGFLLIIIRRKL